MADQGSNGGSVREREAGRLFGLASAYHRRGRLNDAIRGYVRTLSLNPRLADAYNNLGVALRAQKKLGAAVACYRRALSIDPNGAGVYSNLGNALREMGRFDDSITAHKEAVNRNPGSPQAIYNLGLALRDLRQHATALACFDKALTMQPDYVDCHWDRSLTLLQMENYREGFEEYEWRWRLPANKPRDFGKPMWDGSNLNGRTLLLHQEQGFGDIIQFVRYVPLIRRGGGEVIVECQPELARLLSSMDEIDRVVVRGAQLPAFDEHAAMLSLPRIFSTDVDSIPATVPYLGPPEMHSLHLPASPFNKVKVGIAWAGKPTHKNDRNRSCPFEKFLDILDVPGVAFFSVQKGERVRELEAHGCEALVADMGQRLEDFADTAAVMQQLDLVISVDTAVIHLAGALGVPVFTLLPYSGDWRWRINQEDTPWYPTMRLFRQNKPGDWEDVMARVRGALVAMVQDQ